MKQAAAPRRKAAEKRGRSAEWLAALYLLFKGYRILALRHRTPLGEVDIIARKRGVVAFVEVKARRTGAAGVDAVSQTAMRRIHAAADLFLSTQHQVAAGLSLRFDIIVMRPGRLPLHYRDAF